MKSQAVPISTEQINALQRLPPLLDLGAIIVATPAALDLLEKNGLQPAALLSRQQHGDWGSLGKADAEANNAALLSGGRILSSHIVGDDRVWIITDAADSEPGSRRPRTTMLLPSEY